MYFLGILTIFSTTICISVTNQDIAAKNNVLTNDDYILPGNTFPTLYDVRLFLDPGKVDYFYGNVSIRIIPNVETDEIVLHAMEMTIDYIRVYSDRDTEHNLIAYLSLATDDTHLLRIKLTRPISPMQPHVVHIDYVGYYSDNLMGLYVSTYESLGMGTVNLITSQTGLTNARRVFPCYDEPAHKAIFRTTIYAPEQYTVVRTNMPERSDSLRPDVLGYQKHEFEDTLIMSTYLLAYLVSNFGYVSNDVSRTYDIPFKVFSRLGTQKAAKFALEFGQQNMVALEEYTEFRYAFPKIDKAAVPDFAFGAMENWGLVVYREVNLLVQDGVSSTSAKQNVGRLVSHENSHMWFGNEVGPASWTYTWLNEGFANLFESFATELVLPEWRMMDQFVIALQNVMQSDAVLTVNPMTYPVYTPSQILGTFNAVAYQKSGSVLRMLQHFLTPEVFRKGLVIYIRNNSRRAASPAHLYAALQQALSESDYSIPWPLATVMDNWTSQGGFPVVTVRRTAPNSESLFISQERYLTDPALNSTDRWHIPVNWVLSTDAEFSDTRPQAWVPPSFPGPSINIPGLSTAEWFVFNKQQTGYYRVNYDPENWQALSNFLNSSHQTIHVLNRAQIIDDSFNLARTGRLNYGYPLEISQYLIQEDDYIPWAAANAGLSYLDVVLSGSEIYKVFQNYLLNMTARLYQRLGFDAAQSEEHVTPFLRNIILDINCRYGNQECVQRAEELLQQYQITHTLLPDIQTIVFCSGLRGGDPENFDYLWEQYVSSADASQRSILLNALGCTTNETLREFYLNQVIDDESPVREQDRHSIIVAVINSSPENMEAALDFVIEHFADIQPRVQGATATPNIFNAFARRLTTREHNEKMDLFVDTYQSILTAGELASISGIRTNIDASIAWSDLYQSTVQDWLREHYGNSAGVITSVFITIISVIVTIYNHFANFI